MEQRIGLRQRYTTGFITTGGAKLPITKPTGKHPITVNLSALEAIQPSTAHASALANKPRYKPPNKVHTV